MLEGILVFVLGYVCGMYNDKVKALCSKYINKWFDKSEEKNNNE